jgi:glycine/D-amino acid oxidase-like deaminating enzyme
LQDLTPKAQDLVPQWSPIEVLECRAGIRVSRAGQYVPLIEKISNNVWALSAMGSRGLLYHGYAAKKLIEQALL